MTTKDTGGPAFPHDDRAIYGERAGMSLRDWFAGKAMQGFAADPGMGEMPAADIAKLAYVWADAMLAERNKK